MTIPAAVDERLDAIMSVLYLTFNEGYLSRTADAGTLQRVDLADEAIRLTGVLADLCPGHPEVVGLLALELYQRARADARINDTGDLVLLEGQDRSRWDRAGIERANDMLRGAVSAFQPGPYQLQALIAARHANAPSAAETDWPSIVAMYRQLLAMEPSPVVELNHAVAVAMADGPDVGLAHVDAIAGLDGYHLFHSARADLLVRLGRPGDAAEAFHRAIELTRNPSERRFLRRRLDALTG